MKSDVKFVEGKNHAWLDGSDGIEIFLRVAAGRIATKNEHLVAKITAALRHEVDESIPHSKDIAGVYVVTDRGNGTEIMRITETLVLPGGDAYFFIDPKAVFH